MAIVPINIVGCKAFVNKPHDGIVRQRGRGSKAFVNKPHWNRAAAWQP